MVTFEYEEEMSNKVKVIAPTDKDARRSFTLSQYKIIMRHNRREGLPTEYLDQVITLLEEQEEYEKCKEILTLKNLIK